MCNRRPATGILALALVVVCTWSALRASSSDDAAAAVREHLGDLLARTGEFRSAAEAYRQAYDLASDQARLRIGPSLVRSMLKSAQFRPAREVAEQLATLAPADVDIATLRADASWSVGWFEEADNEYRRVLALDPSHGGARNGIARVLLGRSRFDEARREILAALADDPYRAEHHHTLGTIHQAEGNYEEAAAAFRRYLLLLPYRSDPADLVWVHQQIKFLESFGRKVPMRPRKGVAAAEHRVPFRLERDKIIVMGQLNGGRPIEMVLDTGAELTVVSKAVADRIGLRPLAYTLSAGVGGFGLRGLQKGRLDRVQVGTLDLEHVPVLIKNPPLRGLPTTEAESFNPLSFGYSVTVDYRNRVLVMAKTLPEGTPRERMPLWMQRLALVQGVINRKGSAPFVVDTGGQVISISTSTASALRLQPPRHIPLKVYGASGWDPDAFLLPFMHLAFDRIQLENTVVVVLNLDAPSALLGFELGGIVGHKFLRDYRVSIDLARSELRLE